MSFPRSRWTAVGAVASAVGLTVSSAVVAAVVTSPHPGRPRTAFALALNAPLRPMQEIPRRPSVRVPVLTTTRHQTRVTMRLLPSADGISSVALTAYRHAASLANAADPTCQIPWQLVASIGYIESDDGQIGGDSLNARGQEASPIEGLALDGTNGVARVLDGAGHYVRAEGPLQFIPSTWNAWGTDGNGDGRADPQNIFDAGAAAAQYLCSGGQSLASVANQSGAITLYNDSPIYVKNVTNVERAYLAGRAADTVTLIPMPTCPSAKAKPSAAGPCAVAKAKKRKKHKKAIQARVVAAHAQATPRPKPQPKPKTVRTVTPAKPGTRPVPKPGPSATPSKPVAVPTPAPTTTPSLSPTATPTP